MKGSLVVVTFFCDGYIYDNVKYPEHNLVRTKAQFKLLQSAEAAIPKMKAYIKECLSK